VTLTLMTERARHPVVTMGLPGSCAHDEQRVRVLAFEVYAARCARGLPGDQWTDWQQAEQLRAAEEHQPDRLLQRVLELYERRLHRAARRDAPTRTSERPARSRGRARAPASA
jgi:hypothetical protein